MRGAWASWVVRGGAGRRGEATLFWSVCSPRRRKQPLTARQDDTRHLSNRRTRDALVLGLKPNLL